MMFVTLQKLTLTCKFSQYCNYFPYITITYGRLSGLKIPALEQDQFRSLLRPQRALCPQNPHPSVTARHIIHNVSTFII